MGEEKQLRGKFRGRQTSEAHEPSTRTEAHWGAGHGLHHDLVIHRMDSTLMRLVLATSASLMVLGMVASLLGDTFS